MAVFAQANTLQCPRVGNAPVKKSKNEVIIENGPLTAFPPVHKYVYPH